ACLTSPGIPLIFILYRLLFILPSSLYLVSQLPFKCFEFLNFIQHLLKEFFRIIPYHFHSENIQRFLSRHKCLQLIQMCNSFYLLFWLSFILSPPQFYILGVVITTSLTKEAHFESTLNFV